MSGIPTDSGERLNELWGVGARTAYYHKDSHWYMIPRLFPAALFDPHGYILFRTEQELQNCPYINIGERINVQIRIFQLPGYHRMR